MRIPIILASLLAVLLASIAAPACAAPAPVAVVQTGAPSVQTPGERLDKSGKCRGPDGKDATAAACKGAGPASSAGSTGAGSGDIYRLDGKGVCRDTLGKRVKAGYCKP